MNRANTSHGAKDGFGWCSKCWESCTFSAEKSVCICAKIRLIKDFVVSGKPDKSTLDLEQGNVYITYYVPRLLLQSHST